ncbi:MAG TPA: hypothetical protein VKU44_06715 [Terriglobia bacterium]|nr:hypothetical protein [Terriglobia bacterium]
MTGGWRNSRSLERSTLTLGMLLLLSPVLRTPALRAQDHIVSPADLHQAVRNAAQARKQNIEKVDQFFAQPRVEAALKNAKIDPAQVTKAVPYLADDDLARLASRTDKVQRDIAAGSLTNEQLTYIIIALVTAVIIIIIFEA